MPVFVDAISERNYGGIITSKNIETFAIGFVVSDIIRHCTQVSLSVILASVRATNKFVTTEYVDPDVTSHGYYGSLVRRAAFVEALSATFAADVR
jgi:hypothetical protein